MEFSTFQALVHMSVLENQKFEMCVLLFGDVLSDTAKFALDSDALVGFRVIRCRIR